MNNNLNMTTPIRKDSYSRLNSTILRPKINEIPSKLMYQY